jgi:hypothetical protein
MTLDAIFSVLPSHQQNVFRYVKYAIELMMKYLMSTLNIIFIVTYYLALQNALTIYCIFPLLSTKVKLVV